MKLLSALLVLTLVSVARGSGHAPVVSGIVQATTTAGAVVKTAGAVVDAAVAVRPRRPQSPKLVALDDKEAMLGMLLLLGVGHGHRAP